MAYINTTFRWRGAVERAGATHFVPNSYRWRGAVEPAPPVYTTGDAQTQAAGELDTFFADLDGTTDLSPWMDLDMGFAESTFKGSTELAGIFDDHSTAGGDRDGPRVMLKTSDIDDNSIDQGSVLTIRSRTFHVAGVQRDGTGISTVILVEPS